MAIGIYHDTGKFTFESTSELDFLSMATLRKFGAKMRTIYDFVCIPENSIEKMTSGELFIYEQLEKNMEIFQLNSGHIILLEFTENNQVINRI